MNCLSVSLHFCSLLVLLDCCCTLSLSLLILFAVLNFSLNPLSGAWLHCTPCLSKQSCWWQNSKLSFLVHSGHYFVPSCFLFSISVCKPWISFEAGDPERSEKLQHPSGMDGTVKLGRYPWSGTVFLGCGCGAASQ